MTTPETEPTIQLSSTGEKFKATFHPPIPAELLLEATIPNAIISKIIKRSAKYISSVTYRREVPGLNQTESATYFVESYKGVAQNLDYKLAINPA